MLTVPPAFADLTVRREGEVGRRWLSGLPGRVEDVLGLWRCEVVGEPVHGEVAVVVPVEARTGPAVLKVSFPHPGNRSEPGALRQFDGRGAVRLLEADEVRFAMLLERAGPRTLASEPSTEAAIEIAGDLARRLAVPADPGCPSLAGTTGSWSAELDAQVSARPGLLSHDALRRARETIGALSRDTTSTLLHGDLHAGNVLAADREPWLAIDPKGWRGTAAWDAFTVVAGRAGELAASADVAGAMRERIRRYAGAAGVDVDLAVACCQARAVSALLHQDIADGNWFGRDLLRAVTELR